MNERELLRRTSRSFYLTIRLLPRAVRGDVALAYLLARATDTIADTSTAPLPEKAALLRALRAAAQSGVFPPYDGDRWVSSQSAPAEQGLLRSLPGLWARMHAAKPGVRGLLVQVMDRLLEGQIFDLERFGPDAPPLRDAELERYTYLVAGSVGEFWDDLCRLKLCDYSPAPAEWMRTRARHYGQALQLVNILRDRCMDAALGRVYVQADSIPRWSGQAHTWLNEGADYCADLSSGRLRYAALLPALLGFQTLSLCAAQNPGTLTPVKVPRSEVRRWMLRALPVWLSSASAAPLTHQASEQDQ